jgi:5-(carboxyamino)imidazole ribonucleotide mutase
MTDQSLLDQSLPVRLHSYNPALSCASGAFQEMAAKKPVAIIMGSQSDWEIMRFAAAALGELGIAHEALIVSAHRTPDRLYKFAKSAKKQGFKVVIAGAGGAAHLPGMTASLTTLPVLGVPMKTSALEGKDSLLSILQMPAGIPVGTLAIGKPGAINAALLAASILALSDAKIAKRLDDFRKRQTASIGQRPQDTKPKKRSKR